MAPQDLWYLKKRGPDKRPLPSKRHGRGKRWRVTYEDPNTGKPVNEHFDKKTDAETFENNVKADISRGVYVDLDAGKTTVREYAETWRTQQLHRPSTAERVERAFRLHVYPDLGDLAMSAVRNSHIRAWMKGRLAELEESSFGVVFVDVKAMFTDAVDDRIIGRNPCSGIKRPTPESKDRFIPTVAQIRSLADEMLDYYRPIPYVAAGLGLRPAEIFGLEVEHVNFLKREVYVRQQVSRSRELGLHIGKPKTKTSRRDVELPKTVADHLAAHMQKYPPATVELEDHLNPRKPHRREARLIFTTSEGNPIFRNTWSATWRRSVRRAGKYGIPEGFGLHGLRHYFATLLIHSGSSVKTVQLALGHASPTTTLNTYIHEWPEATERTRNIVDDAFAEGGEEVGGLG
ncbi:site-specific integrase [Prauserella endophytica]|uniref:Site-specific integrase n=1 Tax=Prauserella endophytica TaxID=1592324 RepID=A0ABY2S0D9_9PSEU|nr:site-specific integrase [Prauserella endophytica]TKG67014.1 site-specific integrase [Prauserella endophytica]